MKYYSRESERCQSRIAELERQKSRCEAGLAAMEACWAQVKTLCSIQFRPPTDSLVKLIDVIGSLVQPEQLPSIQLDMRRTSRVISPSDASAHFSTEIFDLSRHIPDDPENMNYLTEAFNSRLDATEKLVSAFISICGKGTSGFQQEDLLSKYHAAQSEVRRKYPPPVDRCLVPTYPGKESSLAIGSVTIPTYGSDNTEGTAPQRPRPRPVARRPAQQQNHSGHGSLPQTKRRSCPTQRA